MRTKKKCLNMPSLDRFAVASIVYSTILNSPVYVKSQLSPIHLAWLAKEKLLVKCGMQTVLKPLVEDVGLLETTGITVNGEALKSSVFVI